MSPPDKEPAQDEDLPEGVEERLKKAEKDGKQVEKQIEEAEKKGKDMYKLPGMD